MKKESAIRELKRMADEVANLLDDETYSENHTRWLLKVKSLLEEVFRRNSRY